MRISHFICRYCYTSQTCVHTQDFKVELHPVPVPRPRHGNWIYDFLNAFVDAFALSLTGKMGKKTGHAAFGLCCSDYSLSASSSSSSMATAGNTRLYQQLGRGRYRTEQRFYFFWFVSLSGLNNAIVRMNTTEELMKSEQRRGRQP
jgi:hypothetical protein